MTSAERKKADKITHQIHMIALEMEAAANLFRQGRKLDSARLYVACGEAFKNLQKETSDDPLFVEALKARVSECVQKADICRSGKPVTEVEPGIVTR